MTEPLPMFLTPPQQQVVEMGLIESGFNCVLQMATGSGKTWLAEINIRRVLQSGGRAIYVCPTRALAAELYERWNAQLDGTRIGIFTGDFGKSIGAYPTSYEDSRLLLMTPERLDSCSRHWRTHWGWIPEVDLIVVDEFHLIGDSYRGARLEGGLMRLRRLNPFLQIVGLSATLGNRQELAEWLNGIEFYSSWRPVPLTWRYVRYKRAEEKPELLLSETYKTTSNGGKSLVFAQSRRRAEELARRLCSQGLRAAHHHAGLKHADRRKVETQFRGSDIDVLVTTSTLEVGLNLPVRQVILYDLQRFDGSDYAPLPTNNVWQRVGRAGRYGLDDQGEAVLFAPSWGNKNPNYEKGTFESCQSALRDSRVLAEQIIAELASGLSRTRTELRRTLDESLASSQGHIGNVGALIDEMIESGLLVEQNRAEHNEKEMRLKPTPLGRIASRHMLSPKTVLIFKKILSVTGRPTFFDILLVACSSDDCEPILPVSFEEIGSLSEQLAEEKSSLLNQSPHHLAAILEISPRRLLASIKMALAVRGYTRTGEYEDAAEALDCYPMEIHRLCESLGRLLPAMCSIVEIDSTDGKNLETISAPSEISKLIKLLNRMVETGLNEEGVSLSLVPGIGATWAKRLVKSGICDLEELAQAEEFSLVSIGGISSKRAQLWIEQASILMNSDDAFLLRDLGEKVVLSNTNWPSDIEPYRLRRARTLKVARDGELFIVTGGSDPHRVSLTEHGIQCDCIDCSKGHRCKHVLAVQSFLGDETIKRAESLLQESEQGSTMDLFKLWMH